MCSSITPDCGIVAMTIALLFPMGTCIVQTKSVWVNFTCTKRFFSLSAEAIINARNARLCVRCTIFLLKIKQIPFFVAWSTGLHFWRDSKINSRCFWRCVLSWQVLFQQREMRIFWRLCNNSEIHLWLWKVWSLVVCSQSSFYVTRARKEDKNRQNTLFLRWKKMNLVPNKQLLPKVNHSINIERKNCVWETKYKTLLEIRIVQHAEMKNVITFQPIERLVYTTVKIAKPAATFWIFLLSTKNLQLCCLSVTLHIVLQERRAATTKKRNHRKRKKFQLPPTSKEHMKWGPKYFQV